VVGPTFNRGVDAANGPWSYARVEAAVIHRDSLRDRVVPVILVLVPSFRVGGDLDGGILR
jgi:hypothetical protein